MCCSCSFVHTLVPGRAAGILQMLWDYICGYGVREGRKSCEGKHGTIGGNTFYGVSDLYSVVLLFFFFKVIINMI